MKTQNKERNALAELAERIGGIRTPPTFYLKMDDYHRANDDLAKARRIIAELAKHNISLIPTDCYGCGVLKTLVNCRIIAEEGGAR